MVLTFARWQLQKTIHTTPLRQVRQRVHEMFHYISYVPTVHVRELEQVWNDALKLLCTQILLHVFQSFKSLFSFIERLFGIALS